MHACNNAYRWSHFHAAHNNTRSMSVVSAEQSNPLLCAVWATPYQLPPFHLIQPDHFRHAFPICMAAHREEVATILRSARAGGEGASFDSVAVAFDRAGHLLQRTRRLFDHLCSSVSSEELQSVQRDVAASLALHDSEIYMSGLHEMIDMIYIRRGELSLSREALRLVERLRLDFTRHGAFFDVAAQARYKEIMQRLADLTTLFAQNLMGDETGVAIPLSPDRGDLDGLPDFLVAACGTAASGSDEAFVVPLSRSLVVPFLTFCPKKDLREKVWVAWTNRGKLSPSRDNHLIAQQILLLRAEQAEMHGYGCYADYALADTMAGSSKQVEDLLKMVWAPAKAKAELERSMLMSQASPPLISVDPWDWRYYAEKDRLSKYLVDEVEVKQYFPLDRMVAALFHCARSLFKLEFAPRNDFPSYHPDVQPYEVWQCSKEGTRERIIGIFFLDNFSRPFKNSGAWMNALNVQSRNTADPCNAATRLPVVVNNNNFAKLPEGTLLSYDEARTLFHEFGHGLHGILSDVTFQRLSGTAVLLDFLELPSQLFEHWLSQPQILKEYARHAVTGESIPEELLGRVLKSRVATQGFESTEYTASALLDLHLHQLSSDSVSRLDFAEFESDFLRCIGMPGGVALRHKSSHFQHLFSTSQYAAGYYSYLWAEVLDADAFEAFAETGDVFNSDISARARRYLYSTGNSIDPAEAFKLYRGRDPEVGHMLAKKGLVVESDD